MDLDYLSKREQISFVNAERAPSRSARAAHAVPARGYACTIAQRHSRYRFLKTPPIKRA